jgi:hypothetical protein
MPFRRLRAGVRIPSLGEHGPAIEKALEAVVKTVRIALKVISPHLIHDDQNGDPGPRGNRSDALSPPSRHGPGND